MLYNDYDQVLQEIGECGPWQVRISFSSPVVIIMLFQILLFLLLCVPATLSSVSIFIFTFAAYTPAHLCVGQDHIFTANNTPWQDQTGQYSSCSLPQPVDREQTSNSSAPCSTWVFDDTIFSSTAVEDFSMVCENSWRGGAAQVIASLQSVFIINLCLFRLPAWEGC